MEQIFRFHSTRHSTFRQVTLKNKSDGQQSSKLVTFRSRAFLLTILFPMSFSDAGWADTISSVVNSWQESTLSPILPWLFVAVSLFTLTSMLVFKGDKKRVYIGQDTTLSERATSNLRAGRYEGDSVQQATFHGSSNLEFKYRLSDFGDRDRSVQSKLMDWRDTVLKIKVVREGSALAVLEQVPLREVEIFLRDTDFLGFNVRFEPHSQFEVSNESEVLGTLFAVERVTRQHGSASGTLPLDIILAVERISPGELMLTGPFDFKFDNYIKQPDAALFPRRARIGTEILDDGFGFPTPNLVIETAFSESRAQLVRELTAWISASTSVQVAVGIKMYPNVHQGDRAEAIVFRRGVSNPEQVVQFSPDAGDCPALVFHLKDLFFGVVEKLPLAIQDRIARDETIKIDLRRLRDEILRNR